MGGLSGANTLGLPYCLSDTSDHSRHSPHVLNRKTLPKRAVIFVLALLSSTCSGP